MEQSTDISFLSDLNNKDKNLSLSVKDLTLYSKSVSIENKFTHELLKYSPIKDSLALLIHFQKNYMESLRIITTREDGVYQKIKEKEV